MIKIYYDKDFSFFLKSRENSGPIPVLDIMNCLYEKSGANYTKLNIADVNDLVQAPCIIVVMWSGIIKKIEDRKKNLNLRNKILDRIKNTKTSNRLIAYEKALKAEIERIDKLLNKMFESLEKFDQNITGKYSFFNNSSIWIRLVFTDGIDENRKIDNAKKEIEYFKHIGLYDYGSAKENLEYNIRIQSHNYLESLETGHGNYVTPVLYGDENKAREILESNYVVPSSNVGGQAEMVAAPSNEISGDGQKGWFKVLYDNIIECINKVFHNKEDGNPAPEGGAVAAVEVQANIDGTKNEGEGSPIPASKTLPPGNETSRDSTGKEFKHMEHFHDIALRILLIDDKVGGDPEGTDDCRKKERINIKKAAGKKFKIKKCDKCPKYKECKLHTIKRLMDDGKSGDEKGKIFDQIGETEQGKLKKDYFYWDEQNIECYYCPTIYIDFIDDEVTFIGVAVACDGEVGVALFKCGD